MFVDRVLFSRFFSNAFNYFIHATADPGIIW